jgi:hypothetical protein
MLISITAGITNSITHSSPVIKKTNPANNIPVPMMRIGSRRFFWAAFLFRKNSQKLTSPKTIHVLTNQVNSSGCPFIFNSPSPNDCIILQKQTVSFCIRQFGIFPFRLKYRLISKPYLSSRYQRPPIYTDCIRRLRARPRGCARRRLLC